MSSSEEFKSISELKKLRAANCKIEKIHPTVFASDAEVNAEGKSLYWHLAFTYDKYFFFKF